MGLNLVSVHIRVGGDVHEGIARDTDDADILQIAAEMHEHHRVGVSTEVFIPVRRRAFCLVLRPLRSSEPTTRTLSG